MMYYTERAFEDSDTTLVKFRDVHEDIEEHDVITYVKFKYDLSHDEVDSIKQESEDVEYDERFDTFDDWVECVAEKAMEHECWKHDKDNDWEFWSPFPCLEIEV
jgi:hypothetical protein